MVNVFGVLLIPETAIFVYFGDIKRTEVKRLIFEEISQLMYPTDQI